MNKQPIHWRVVSRGIAAENLRLDSKLLEVYCPELSGFADGEITSFTKEDKVDGIDDLGRHYSISITTQNTIQCQWKPNGDNRITPPNIRRGERVEVWQYADADKYYWAVTGEDNHLRRLETVTHAYSNTKDESTEELTKENSYWHQIDTHNKVITLQTSKSDGEPFLHSVQIDAKNGVFHYRDDAGNYIQVESHGNVITVENGNGCKVILNGRDCTMKVPGTLDISAGTIKMSAGSTTIDSPVTIHGNTATTGSLTNNGKNVGSSHTHGGVQGGRGSTGAPN